MPGKKNKRSKKTIRQSRNTIIVVSVLSVLAVIGVYFGITRDIFKISGYERTIQLPTIETKVKSTSSGEEFYLNTDIMLTLDRSKNESYNDIYQIVKTTVNNIDYDKVAAEDFTYLKESIKESLSGIIKEEAGMNIYITDFKSSREPIVRDYSDPRNAMLPIIR